MPVNLGETKNNKFYLFFSPRRRGSSVVCDNGRFISPKECGLPPQRSYICRQANSEQTSESLYK